MQNLIAEVPAARVMLLVSVPVLYLLATAASGFAVNQLALRWRMARWCAGAALLASVASLVWLMTSGAAIARGPWGLGLRIDALGGVMLLLVSFIGWIIIGYSQSYLGGERGQPRYIRCLLLTLAAVTLLVLSNHMVVLAMAWIATSLALHGLLTFFSARPQALIAAHKKFIASRVADASLLAAVALIGTQLGTLEIDRAIAAAKALPQLPVALQCAAVLLVVSALLKCAQLPVHGWLIQVMEAPTPVSALLHAGVVNLGGFLLIRMGSLVGDVPAAQALLVVVGSVTAVVAALVMMTRISIKVSLAWSTCAQMGFMLMQCGLGLYDLALLHLLAHSLYKAYAFLGAGAAVEHHRLLQMTPSLSPLSLSAWFAGALCGMLLVALAAFVWGFSPSQAPALWALGGIVGLALAPLLARSLQRMPQDHSQSRAWRLMGPAAALGVALAYFGLHALLGRWMGADATGAAPAAWLVTWVLLCFGLLFVVQGAVRARPEGILARKLYPWMFSGLYLDELFTRLTFRLWPAHVPSTHGTLNKPIAPPPAPISGVL
jgi:NAD(P)H-quinone oxidoreductase subunit 5